MPRYRMRVPRRITTYYDNILQATNNDARRAVGYRTLPAVSCKHACLLLALLDGCYAATMTMREDEGYNLHLSPCPTLSTYKQGW